MKIGAILAFAVLTMTAFACSTGDDEGQEGQGSTQSNYTDCPPGDCLTAVDCAGGETGSAACIAPQRDEQGCWIRICVAVRPPGTETSSGWPRGHLCVYSDDCNSGRCDWTFHCT